MTHIYKGEEVKEALELRKVCTDKLHEFLEKDKDVVVLDADLMGSLGTGSLQKEYTDRIVNCGIMEAQEISCAAGMRRAGLKPFVHTFTAFASRRCLDQIFISSLYQDNPITVIASDAGIQAVHNGGTHMSFEDMGLIRGLAGTTVIEPTDSTVLKAVLDEVYENNDKFYWIRLTRKNVFKVYEEGAEIKIGKANIINEGKDVTIIANGMMVHNARVAAKKLELEGINATILDMFTLKPIDKAAIIKYCKDAKLVVTAENHSITNGLGSAVAEILSENCPNKLVRVGVKERYGQVGTLEFLQKEYELTADDIYKAVKENM
ncbi:transketolase C-terminal domain-containing protein [Streptobacillus felis]|uniref:Transketolase family protein n=1 Tax=Streptobacillus felis TaxID=1384509 RepID=A0A7Z0T7C9_9FUSO|nr:transketolase C-terminal domain-containing protein [Streptobacillus felis]NYV28161.1 transketolase family protein [Streptobacillus felis]